jgi:tripartite-type tricarboxylate transporter receptor subunit TctC
MHSIPDTRRRRLLAGALAAAASGSLAVGRAHAQAQAAWPTQPLRLVIPFGPGGFADITARAVAQKMGERMGQGVVIDNRPGAGGIVASNYVLGAPRDGHTAILFSNGTAITPSLMTLPFDPEADFAPVSSMAYFDLLLLTGANNPLRDLASVVAEGKRRPVTLGSINPGSTQHLSAELFKSVTGIQATVVPFKTSGDVQLALQRGDVDVGFETYTALRGAVDGNLLRPLACTGAARSAWLPQVPTAREAGVANYEVAGWNAIYVAKGTPPAAIAAFNAALQTAVAQPDLRKRFLDMGADPRTSTPEEMAAVFTRDRRKWAQVIRDANIKVS